MVFPDFPWQLSSPFKFHDRISKFPGCEIFEINPEWILCLSLRDTPQPNHTSLLNIFLFCRELCITLFMWMKTTFKLYPTNAKYYHGTNTKLTRGKSEHPSPDTVLPTTTTTCTIWPECTNRRPEWSPWNRGYRKSSNSNASKKTKKFFQDFYFHILRPMSRESQCNYPHTR